MKKNIAMRVAAFLFILTMISTCAFATTFAKYTTHGEADDSARVAKWGVELAVEVADNGLFQESYVNADNETTVNADANVKSNLVAPGTKVKDAITVSLSGKPEVAVSLKYDVTFELEDWVIKSGEYCPLIFTVTIGKTSKTYQIGDEIANIAALKEAVVRDIENLTQIYGPNHDLGAENANNVSVSWEWKFSTNAVSDSKDTELGNLKTAPTIEFGISVVVEQVNDLTPSN